MANKESSEVGNLPTSPMAKRARMCETTGEGREEPYWVALRFCDKASGFDLDDKDDPATLVPSTWGKNYDIVLHGRIGLQCHNLQKGTDLKFKRWEKYSIQMTWTLLADFGRCNSLGARITWVTLASRIKQMANERLDDDWDEDTPAIHEFYKGPMPKWVSDESLERGSKKYYVVPDSELHDNDWLQLLMEVAFFSKANRNLEAYLPLEIKKVVVETFEDYTTEPSEKLKADNAIFYISYKCCSGPFIRLAGSHRSIVRKTTDGKVALTKEQEEE